MRDGHGWKVRAAAVAAVLAFSSAHAQTPPRADPAFTAWRDGFIARARARGRAAETMERLFAGIAPDPAILELDRRQTHFVQPMWAYLEARVSPARVESGRALLRAHAELLAAIEAAHGIPAPVLIAVWGMESRYGEASLDYDARVSLATLAYAGRRRPFFEGQLFALAQMIERGDADSARVPSSWDGGLGLPQFMPTSFLTDAIDWDGDGVRDLWNNPADALGSIAHYLRTHGWRTGEPLFLEVRAPASIGNAAAQIPRPVSAWAALGVTPREDASGRGALQAKLVRPDGATGPAFLAFHNYDVLTAYNGAPRYGVAAALLARAIAGEPAPHASWPKPADAMTHEEIIDAQTALAALGYDVGEADGLFGERTWLALNAFRRTRGLAGAAYPDRASLAALRTQTAP